MKLSVIVTCYNQNRDNLIRKCLDSVLDLEIQDAEFILVDDCSTDGSYEILKEYEKNFAPLVTVIRHEQNKGAGGARNTGIRAAKGEYISYIDGDDFVSERFYWELLKTLRAAGDVDLVGPDYVKTTYEGDILYKEETQLKPQMSFIDDDTKARMLVKGERSVGRLYRRALIVDNGLWFPENIAFEDSPVTCFWTNLCNSYAYCPDAVYYYRKTAKSLTTSRLTVKKTEEHYKSQQVLIENGRRLGVYEKFSKELDYRLYRRDFLYKLKECVLDFSDEERDAYYKKVCALFKDNTTDLLNNPYIEEKDRRDLREFLEDPCAFGKKQASKIKRKTEFLKTCAKIKHTILRK